MSKLTLTPIKLSEIENKRKQKSDIYNVITEFIESDFEAVLVDSKEYKNSNSCYYTLYKAIKHYRFSGISVIIRSENVYIVKK